MRCDDCRANPQSESRYCECCGRRVSAPEAQALETPEAPVLDELLHDLERAASAVPQSGRCESCGGPAEDADLCAACQRAFHSVIETKKPEAPAENPVAAVQEVASAEPSPAPVSASSISAPPDLPSVSPAGIAPLPPPLRPAAAAAAAIAPPPAITVREPVPVREPIRSTPRPRPVPPRERSIASVPPSPPRGRSRPLFIAVALVVVALAICVPLSTPWLVSEEPASTPREEHPEEVRAQPVAQRVPTSSERDDTSESPEDTTPDPPASVPVRPSRPARHEPPPAAPGPPTEALVAETTLPPAEPVAAPAPEATAAPVGPFFEARQVNESPQVASRVEPRVPDDLQGPVNDVVILRVLVSQTGHVSLVNVLRRSRAGVALDDAVVAAVKQWTFAPARKRGEAVSCWYHVGVPIQRAG